MSFSVDQSFQYNLGAAEGIDDLTVEFPGFWFENKIIYNTDMNLFSTVGAILNYAEDRGGMVSLPQGVLRIGSGANTNLTLGSGKLSTGESKINLRDIVTYSGEDRSFSASITINQFKESDNTSSYVGNNTSSTIKNVRPFPLLAALTNMGVENPEVPQKIHIRSVGGNRINYLEFYLGWVTPIPKPSWDLGVGYEK